MRSSQTNKESQKNQVEHLQSKIIILNKSIQHITTLLPLNAPSPNTTHQGAVVH
jgi:hypothetical protein